MFGRLFKTADGAYALETPYDPSKLPVIRSLPGARWDRDNRVWTVSTADHVLLELVEALNGLGVEIPPEILTRANLVAQAQAQEEDDLDLDSRLFPFQVEGVHWLRNRHKALLSDEMGAGKTAQSLQALPEGAPVVAIVPATLKRNWVQEIETWRPSFHATILKGRDSFRWAEPGEIVITNYEILAGKVEGTGKNRKAVLDLPEPPDGTVLICDEIQKAKSPSAHRSMRLRAIKDAVLKADGRVWLMTGTPLLNTPLDLWHVLKNADLTQDSFGSYTKFFKTMGGYKKQIRVRGGKRVHVTEWGTPQPDAPRYLARVMLRRTREEVLPQLPGKTHRTVVVNGLNRETRKLLDGGYQALLEAMGNESESQAGAPLPSFAQMSECKAALAKSKMPHLLKLVEDYEENEEPVVVFSDHLAPVHALGEREGWATITGETPNARRQDIVNGFQAGEFKGLALTIPAGNYGLTLTRAHHMIFCDLNWVPANNVQAQDRILRIGQDRGCVYTTIIMDHALDHRIHEVLMKKMDIITRTVHQTSDVNPSASRLGDDQVKAIEAITQQQAEARAREEAEKKAQVEERDLPEGIDCPACGRRLELRISKSAKNPDRPYYSCRPCDYFQWADVEPVSRELHDWTLRALQALAGRCDGAVNLDGVGYNGTDTNFGRQLAMRDSLTDDQVRAARKMLVKYMGQLSQCGCWPPPDWKTSEGEYKLQFKRGLDKGFMEIVVDAVLVGRIVKIEKGYRGFFYEDNDLTFSEGLEHRQKIVQFPKQKDVKEWVRQVIRRRKEAKS